MVNSFMADVVSFNKDAKYQFVVEGIVGQVSRSALNSSGSQS